MGMDACLSQSGAVVIESITLKAHAVLPARHTSLSPATNPPKQIVLRDGALTVYRRSRSQRYQCRFRLASGAWHRQTTGASSIEAAIARACDMYDEARYRTRLGLAHRTHLFAHIAQPTLAELGAQVDAAEGRTAYSTYITCIEKYFIPYFGDRYLEQLEHRDIQAFELWRDRQMARKPKTSTLNNFTMAWNRVVATAVKHGYISERVPVPKLSNRGLKGSSRPAFDAGEIEQLLAYMETWKDRAVKAVEGEIRYLLVDYVQMLLYTGMRHSTEAMGICWRHLEWHTAKGTRYLRVWVDGKTGGRWLIARHEAVAVLKRLHQRQADIQHLAFEDLFRQRLSQKLFRIHNGYQPVSLNGTFRRLLRDAGLLVDGAGKTRTLYSLRHTYATQALLANRTDIHTLARQMGNSAAMIERHYSKLTATMAADRLA